MQQWLGSDNSVKPQGRGNLGERMQKAFEEAFNMGYERVLLVGSDCPGISVDTFEEAFEILANEDIVLGPATDGGYYLIGFRDQSRPIFKHIGWGTEKVLSETLDQIKAQQLTVGLLEELHDIDRPEDLAHLNHHSSH